MEKFNVGFEVFTAVVMKSIIFWDMTPCSLLIRLPPAYLLVLAEIICSTLKMEAICSSETSGTTQRTTRRHIPEEDTGLRCSSTEIEEWRLFQISDINLKLMERIFFQLCLFLAISSIIFILYFSFVSAGCDLIMVAFHYYFFRCADHSII
jgi:hypothetical protein